MVNEHAERDADWSHDRLRDPRPGKKPRLSAPEEPPLSPPPPPRPAPPPSSNASKDPAVPRILLANLDYNTTEHDIDDFFRAAGVDVKHVSLVKVSPGNRVNGNAYVYVLDLRSVDVALDLDGAEFRGRKLRVSTMPEDQRTVCVRGMPRPSSEKDVRDLFRGCNIVDARSRPVKGGPPDMNTWFVDFADEDSFRRALDKDRSLPGLTICIATAQGRGTPRSRDYRDGGVPPDVDRRAGGGGGRDDRYRDDPPREDRGARDRDERPHRDDRQPREDRLREERALEGRDSLDRHPDRSRDDLDRHARDDYDRRPRNESPRRYDRRADPDRNGDVGNGFSSRARAHSRSRSPPARYERERRYDRHDYDRRDRRGAAGGYDDGYDRHRDRRYSPDYYRDREYDRDYDRRDRYRSRDYEPRYERDYHRRERDYGRDHRRDSRVGSRYDREPADPRYERERKMDPPLDPAVTTVLTNLPFCEDRERVVDTLARTLEDLNDALMIKNITPVGRRCGACIVVFRDEESYSKALAMNSITISTRKVNILPLEVPSVARVQKLQPGFIPEDIIDDMRRNYGVESLYIKLKQSDQLLLGIEDSRFLVRLLDIDGRPLLHSRYATVSYIPSRNHANDMGGRSRRSPHDDFSGPGGRGGGAGGRDRDGRDDDEGPPDRRRFDNGERERRDSGSDHGRRDGGDREARGYSGKSEWRVQFVGPNDRIEERLVKTALSHIGLEKLTVVPIDDFTVEVHGGSSGESTMKQVLDLPGMKLPSAMSLRGITARPSSSSALKKRPPPPLTSRPRSDFDSSEKPAKKMKRSEEDNGSGKVPTSLQAALTDRFYVSPMTPPPGDTSVVNGKKETPNPELPQICERLETLRSAITGRGSKNSDGQNYAEFCGNLKSLCEPQVLKYTTRANTDPLPPVVWTGSLSKGSKAACNGYLVLRSSQGEEYVKKAVAAMPKDVKVEFRGRFDDEKFDHLLTSEAVVVVVKAQEEDNSGMDSTPTDKRPPRSREYFKGILQSLRSKQRLGIGRYVWEGQKYLSLCIPPNPYVFKKLRLPWRYQDFAGHDSLLVVVGPKSASQKK